MSHNDENTSNEATNGIRPGDKEHYFDKPENVRRFIRGFFISCVVFVLFDVVFFFHHKHLSFGHGEMPVEGWFGFYALYGFVACVLLVLVAKQLRKILMRDEDYYDR